MKVNIIDRHQDGVDYTITELAEQRYIGVTYYGTRCMYALVSSIHAIVHPYQILHQTNNNKYGLMKQLVGVDGGGVTFHVFDDVNELYGWLGGDD